MLKPLLEQRILCCPTDHAPLLGSETGLDCPACHSRYPIDDQGVLDLRPRGPLPQAQTSLEPNVQAYYEKIFQAPMTCTGQELGWGAEEKNPAYWNERKRAHVNWISTLLKKHLPSNVLVDFSGGAGHYTRSAAKFVNYVVHMDLAPDNLAYASRKARGERLENIVHVRGDYFQPPFHYSLSGGVSLDTLIYGRSHEHLLLRNIHASLRDDGLALLDFHNRWHNPLRAAGVLPRIIRQSYGLREVRSMSGMAGLVEEVYAPWHQETVTHPAMNWLPATRHTVVVRSLSSSNNSAE